MKPYTFVFPCILLLLACSCNFVFEAGMEPASTVQATAALPSLTASPSPSPTVPTNTPTDIPTNTASPTPLPGSVVIPLSSMKSSIPWLPADETKTPAVFVVTFNVQKPPFDNPLVRKAFAASVDRDAIVKMAKNWYAVDPIAATTFIPPQTLGRDLYGEVGINFDPILAKDLLTQAGYTEPASFPKVTFLVSSYGEVAPGARLLMARSMAELWHNTLGVTVVAEDAKSRAFGDRIKSNPPELFWIGWTVEPGNDPDFIRPIFRTTGENNLGHFASPEFDSLVVFAASSHIPDVRQALYIEAERLLCETEVGIIPLYHVIIPSNQ